MAYTVVQTQIVSTPLVAIYRDTELKIYEAFRVLAIGTFRDPKLVGSDNVLVPLHEGDFSNEQDHFFASRREVTERLPMVVISSQRIWDEIDDSVSILLDRVDGVWVISE